MTQPAFTPFTAANPRGRRAIVAADLSRETRAPLSFHGSITHLDNRCPGNNRCTLVRLRFAKVAGSVSRRRGNLIEEPARDRQSEIRPLLLRATAKRLLERESRKSKGGTPPVEHRWPQSAA